MSDTKTNRNPKYNIVFGDSEYHALKVGISDTPFKVQFIYSKNNEYERLILYPVIFTSFSVSKSERIQVLNGFDENSHINAFGRNPDSMRFSGVVLADGKENRRMKDVGRYLTNIYEDKLRAFSAAKAGLGVGVSGPGIGADGSNRAIFGIVHSFNYEMSSSSNSYIQFSFEMIETKSLYRVGSKNTSKKMIVKEAKKIAST